MTQPDTIHKAVERIQEQFTNAGGAGLGRADGGDDLGDPSGGCDVVRSPAWG